MQLPSSVASAKLLTDQGIVAFRAGDKSRAREFLENAVRIEPLYEQAWLWLSGVVETDAERKFCLDRIIAINPQHPAAQRGLGMLSPSLVSASPFKTPRNQVTSSDDISQRIAPQIAKPLSPKTIANTSQIAPALPKSSQQAPNPAKRRSVSVPISSAPKSSPVEQLNLQSNTQSCGRLLAFTITATLAIVAIAYLISFYDRPRVVQSTSIHAPSLSSLKQSLEFSDFTADWTLESRGMTALDGSIWVPRIRTTVKNTSGTVQTYYLRTVFTDSEGVIKGDGSIEIVRDIPPGKAMGPIFMNGEIGYTTDFVFLSMSKDETQLWRFDISVSDSYGGPWESIKSGVVELPGGYQNMK